MPTVPIIGKSDRDDLGEMLRWWRSQSQNRRIPPGGQGSAAPEVYIARTPAEGVPALASDVGTGTGDVSGDAPGQAECLVYEIQEDSSAFTGTGSDNTSGVGMQLVSGLTQTVYNLSSQRLDGGEWIVVARDKFGRWVVTGPNAGGGSGTGVGDTIVDHVHVVQSIADTGTGTAGLPTWYCERVTLPGPSAWPPVADSTVVYNDVVESENRIPRLMDAAGGAVTHIIPLLQDRNGNKYIVFWKTDTTATFEVPTSFTITQDPTTCTITATPVLGTYTVYLEVAPTTDPRTGLKLRIT